MKKIKTIQNDTSDKLAGIIIEGIERKKGKDIVSLNFRQLPNSVCSFFIVCHGTSRTHVEAIAESVDEIVKQTTGSNPWHVEGFENAEWILLDYADVVVHIFQAKTRTFYQLEDLWADAEINRIQSES